VTILEVAAAEVAVGLHMADHGLDDGTAAELALDLAETPRFCPAMKTRCGLNALCPR
jgi:hypothetical protein